MAELLRSSSRSRYLWFLRVWIGFVAFMALGNTVQCFVDHSFLVSRLYTSQPEKNVTGLAARLFGVWTLLAAVLRFACAIDIHNKILYHLTFLSFFLALGHFASEVFLYKTAQLTVGVCAPLIVSSISIVLMAVGYWSPRPETNEEKDETAQLARKAKFL
ncbi:ergosterol biosynthetic protein 28 homolog [Babylonia areolata]|uniref:ergosterol biosynthetic protein 28 homolog n=1 Tax=Babylonia areolata TaxID=304850 RepID=UPI003FD0F1C8